MRRNPSPAHSAPPDPNARATRTRQRLDRPLASLPNAAALLFLVAVTAGAQVPGAGDAAREFEMTDNSFLIEEAFNQEPGVVQTTLTFLTGDGGWGLDLSQEWPLGTQTHQFGYTIPYESDGSPAIADLYLDYRYQAITETARRPAFSPRLSLILPTTRKEDESGQGNPGWEVNLPLSKRYGDFYVHVNVGGTGRPGVDTPGGEEVHLLTPWLGGSVIWRARRFLNLLLESLAEFEETVSGPGTTDREVIWVLSPGLRTGRDFGRSQFVAGLAVPIGLTRAATDIALLVYLSYEFPFRR
jgi:hypothetical protein